MMDRMSICSIVLSCSAFGVALGVGCNEQKADPGAMTSTKDTPGSTLLTSSDASAPSNPRGVTMKGAPVGSTVSGEEPADPAHPPLKNQQ